MLSAGSATAPARVVFPTRTTGCICPTSFGDVALDEPGYVRGRDVNDPARMGAGGFECVEQSCGSYEVRLEGIVDGSIKSNGGGAVDHHVDGGELCEVLVGQSEPL